MRRTSLKLRSGFYCLFFVFMLAGRIPHAHGSTVCQKKEMQNGAIVVSSYMPGSALVTVQLRVLSGLSNEGEYAGSGISHLIEHMLFKGMDRSGTAPVKKAVKAMGGTMNGSTGLDSAEYNITVPKEFFKEAMELIVSMAMDPVFGAEELSREKEVVLNEMNMIEDDPELRIMRLLFETAYRRHVYKYPIIGIKSIFQDLDKEDLEKYHAAVYVPERVVLGVAGGIDPDTVFSEAEKLLSGYSRASNRTVCVELEPAQVSSREAVHGADVEVGYLALGYHVPGLYSEDMYALNVLAMVLGDGEDSLFYRELVQKRRLLHSVNAFSLNPVYPGLFVVIGSGEAEKIEEARTVIMELIETFKKVNISEKGIRSAKDKTVMSYLRTNETTNGAVSSVSSAVMFTGNPFFLEEYVSNIGKVSPQDVRQAAAKYLSQENSSTVYLVPADKRCLFSDQTGPGDVSGLEESRTVEKVLTNGLRLVAVKTGKLPVISFTFAARGGLMSEKEENSGISNLTAAMLLKGTSGRKEDEIVPFVQSLGGDISSFSGFSSAGVSMDILSGNFKECVDLLGDVIMRPVFPEEEITKEKEKIIAEIREQEKDIFSFGMVRLRKLLYGEHPYSRRVLGEKGTLDSMDRKAIKEFYRKIFVPKGAVLCVAGDIDPQETIERLSSVFSPWKAGGEDESSPAIMPDKAWSEESVQMDKEQSLVLVGFRGVSVKDKRKYVLDVISSMLSGRDGELFERIREDMGMSYVSGAVNGPNLDDGYFVLYAATTRENLEKVRDKIMSALDFIIAGEFSEEDLESSKMRTITDNAVSLEGVSAVSMTVALNSLYGLGVSHQDLYASEVRLVTREDVRRVASEFLEPELAAVVEMVSAK